MQTQKTIRNTRTLLLLAILLLAAALACRTLAPLGLTSASPTVGPTATTAAPAPAAAQPLLPAVVTSEEQALIQLYSLVNPSVVNITLYAEGPDGTIQPFSQGSGFVYDANRHIVTNAHVVQGAEQIDVTFYNGLIRPAKVIGSDPHSDLAVIEVEEVPAGINPLPLGRMEDLAVGQTVVAIGNPFGYAGTLTKGIISALGRTIPALTAFSIPASVQTDAAINPGNSGGPLLNLRGEVIGVNDQIETSSISITPANSGVGFAIPVSVVARVVPRLIEDGKYEWPWLGVRGGSVDYTLARAMNLPVEKGAYLWQITAGGPADKAGLRGASKTVEYNGRQVDVGGDVVTGIDGRPVESFDDLLVYIALETSPGQQVTLTILRSGKYQDVKVTLGTRPDSVE